MVSSREVISGYQRGWFLMADGEELSWYSTRRRTLIPLDERFHYPRSLRPLLRRRHFQPRINGDFMGVVRGCANRSTTWINQALMDIYWQLNQEGWAYSFETWLGDQLAGGILGIVLGGAFIGESMFFQISNGSKVAMVLLVAHLRQRGFRLFDAQLMNPHLARFGAFELPQQDYLQQLQQAILTPCSFLPLDPENLG
ncbi:MAG: leucyl/phenylalanyl-tRNA--protein transferase [Thermostichales cyanobacterium BF4_bins_65]